MNLQKKLNMKLNIITCPSAVKKVLDFPCGKGLGDWVVPNLCEFSSKTRLLKSALSRTTLPLPLVVARIRRLCVAQSLRVFFENSFINVCALAHALPLLRRGKDWKGWRSQFRSVAEEWRRFDAGTLESLVFGC